MAEPLRRLHHIGLHVSARLVPGGMLAGMALALFVMVRESGRWLLLPAALLPVGLAWLLGRTLWRTRQVFGANTHLEVESGPNRRRIPFAEVVGVDRPWWALNPVFAPQMIVLRDDSAVLFFPADGAEGFVRVHIPAGP